MVFFANMQVNKHATHLLVQIDQLISDCRVTATQIKAV